MNNNSNTNEIISEVSSAGQTFVSGKVEDGGLHVTLKGNPADMVTYLIGSLNHTLDAIADVLMYEPDNYPENKEEFYICAANFLIGYYRRYKQYMVIQGECPMPIFEAFRNCCERFDANIDHEEVIDFTLELPSDDLDVYMTHEEISTMLKAEEAERKEEQNG